MYLFQPVPAGAGFKLHRKETANVISTTVLITILSITVSIIATAFAVYFGIKSSRRADVTDVEKKAMEMATINVKLDQIGLDVKDIKYDITDVKQDVIGLTERMIVVEQSTKSAHHRLDGITGKEERE